MLIYLVRHGIADESGISDQARELTREGVMQTRAMVEKFKPQAPELDVAMMSPYSRATQTASILRQAIPDIRFRPERRISPEGDAYDVMDLLEQVNAQQILLVSHNPLLANLLCLLVDGTLESGRGFQPSHLVCVEMDVVAPGCGRIMYTLTP